MHTSIASFAIAASLVFKATRAEDLSICGPFQITSTSGALGNTSYGAQVPKTGSEMPYAEYLITADGALFTSAGQPCGFLPKLTCGGELDYASAPVLRIGEFRQLSVGEEEYFEYCNNTAASPGIDTQYIRLKEGINEASGPTNGQCGSVALQASRCSGTDEYSERPLPGTPTSSEPSSTFTDTSDVFTQSFESPEGSYFSGDTSGAQRSAFNFESALLAVLGLMSFLL